MTQQKLAVGALVLLTAVCTLIATGSARSAPYQKYDYSQLMEQADEQADLGNHAKAAKTQEDIARRSLRASINSLQRVKEKTPEQKRQLLNQCQAAISLMPESSVFYLYRAEAYEALGENFLALADIEKAFELNDEEWFEEIILVQRSQLYRAMGETAKADADMLAAKELGW